MRYDNKNDDDMIIIIIIMMIMMIMMMIPINTYTNTSKVIGVFNSNGNIDRKEKRTTSDP